MTACTIGMYILGPEKRRFRARIAGKLGLRMIAVGNGNEALELARRAMMVHSTEGRDVGNAGCRKRRFAPRRRSGLCGDDTSTLEMDTAALAE